jgi:flagellar hook protein FlgE
MWSGVSGLRAHQTAIDIEGHNIANVNTNGFKYSRANFAEVISQNHRISTAPYGYKGGENSKQVGLGTGIPTTTRIYTQGVTTETDRVMDAAIQGNGFFVVSDNDGHSYSYTRDGAFGFDADGNLVSNSGMVVQGWNRYTDGTSYFTGDRDTKFYNHLEGSPTVSDKNRYQIDTTNVVDGIKINPHAKISPFPTDEVEMVLNLNSSNKVENKKLVYPTRVTDASNYDGWDWIDNGQLVDDTTAPFNTAGNDVRFNDMFDRNNERFNLQANQGVSFSVTANAAAGAAVTNINLRYVNPTAPAVPNTATGEFRNMNDMLNAIQAQLGTSGVVSFVNGAITISAPAGAPAGSAYAVSNNITPTSTPANAQKNYKLTQFFERLAGRTYNPTTAIDLHQLKARVLQTIDDVSILTDDKGRQFELESARIGNNNSGQGMVMEFDHFNRDISLPAGTANPSRVTFRYTDGEVGSPPVTNVDTLSIPLGTANTPWTAGTSTRLKADGTTETYNVSNTVVYFKTNEQLRQFMNNIVVDQDHNGQTDPNIDTEVLFKADGTLKIDNIGNNNDFPINIKVEEIVGTKKNDKFFNVFKAMQGTAATQGGLSSKEIYMPTFAASIGVYDTLGSKHTLRVEYRKNDLNEWDFRVILPRPANIQGAEPEGNILRGGKVNFNTNGSLLSATPKNIVFSADNGSRVLQDFKLNFGDINEFNGVTAFDYTSSEGKMDQNGYPGGELVDVALDDSGKVIGTFSDGRNLALAQVALADFDNQEGLNANGANLLGESANSGNGHIATGGFGGRGNIKAGRLEKSNTDLSSALTQLIIIQRAYQAQTKTITTSDQMLQTLLQIKQ